jgi:hypothetical protein
MGDRRQSVERHVGFEIAVVTVWLLTLVPSMVPAGNGDLGGGHGVRWPEVVLLVLIPFASGLICGRRRDWRGLAELCLVFVVSGAAVSVGGVLTFPGQDEAWGAIVLVNVLFFSVAAVAVIGVGTLLGYLSDQRTPRSK